MESSPRCATLPMPTPMPSSLPTSRLQTQMQESPRCVQNAMMTKDKKPFTYTPGGIDLSQIKSPRMARRIERNANCEGVTNVPKVSPLAQPNKTNLPSAVPSAMSGMPVQVFPTGPPAPPPPPPKQSLDINKNTNGTQRAEKTPIRNFEPPPIGFRPEIKIPPNPMASLKPAPKPQIKNDFWVEEYKKERSKSPNVQTEDRNNVSSNDTPNTQQPLTPKTEYPTNNSSQTVEHRPNTPKRQWSPQRISTPTAESTSPHCESPSSKSNMRVDSPFSSQQPNPLLPKPLSPIKMENSNPPNKQMETQKQPEEVLTRQQSELIHQQEVLDQIRRQQRWQQPPQTVQQQRQQQQLKQQQLQQQLQQQQQQYQQQQLYQQQQRELQQQQIQQQQQQQIQQQQQKQYQQQQMKRPDAQPIQNVNIGNYNATPSHSEAFSLLTQETPQWMARKGNNKETPEWVDGDDSSSNAAKSQFVFQEVRPPQQQQQQQLNAPKERIIPIQIERTPPVSSGGFEYPQAHYNNSNYAGSPVHSNPNKFVDQGYSNFVPSTADESTKFAKNSQPSTRGARNVPIKIDGQISPFNVTVSDPLSQSPIVLQNDPRTLERQSSWGNSSPNQSKSFRVLQKITDHDTEIANMPAELQGPQYSKPLGPDDMNENQLRKLQLNENEMRRFKNNANEERGQRWGPAAPTNGSDENVTSRPSRRFAQQHAVFQPEDQSQKTYQADPKLYSGSSIPSRSFKILQAMVTPENAGKFDAKFLF